MGLLKSVIDKMDIKEKDEYSLEEKRAITDVCLATVALSTYAAACDGTITLDEYMEADLNVATINKQFHLSDELMKTVSELSMKHSITWEEVTEYLDVLSVETLENMQAGLENVVNASDGINESEDEVIQRFNDYIQSKK